MADLFNCDYYEFETTSRGLKRYLFCLKETFKVFRRDYSQVFVQNPSIVLCFWSVILKVFFNKILIIDAHNAGVRPKEGKYHLLQIFNRFILSQADYVIVTNSSLSEFLNEKNKIASVAIPDPIPRIERVSSDVNDKLIFVICSWAVDEPIDVYLDAAHELNDYQFVFSGNYKKYFQEDAPKVPNNVTLAGFVSSEKYTELLNVSGLILDLTLRDDCLVCGAYEAISVNSKVILSDTAVNKELFEGAAFYSFNNKKSLVNQIRIASQCDNFDKIVDFKERHHAYLIERRNELLDALEK